MITSDTSAHRTKLIKKNVIASFLIKAWSALVILAIVPVTLHTLGEYKNGLWLTISSILAWIDYMDVGLGNGLRNRLAEALAHHDYTRAKSIVSSTFLMLTVVIIPACCVIISLIYCSDTYSILNVSKSLVKDLPQVLILTVILVCSTFIFKIIGNVYMGLQLPAISNLLVTLGHTLSLVGSYIVYYSGSHSLMHIAIVNTLSPLIVYLVAYPITFQLKYKYLKPDFRLSSLSEAKNLFDVGLQFFILQISGIILLMSTNLIISKLFSPEIVTPYQITYRYFSILLVLFTVICVPFWNATTDAYARGDISWIKNANIRLNKITLLLSVLMVLMLLFSNVFYKIWIGKDVKIPFAMSATMAIYIFILIISSRYSYIINGIGKLRIQLMVTATAALLFVPLAYIAAKITNNVIGIMIVMCLVNIPGLVINYIQFNKLINGTAKGIWLK